MTKTFTLASVAAFLTLTLISAGFLVDLVLVSAGISVASGSTYGVLVVKFESVVGHPQSGQRGEAPGSRSVITFETFRSYFR